MIRKCSRCNLEKDIQKFQMGYRKRRLRHCRDCGPARQTRAALVDRNRAHVATLLSGGCVDCGLNDIVCLDFDHRDPKKKLSTIARLTIEAASISRINLEAAKCDVVCSNCHRKRTARTFGWWRLDVAPQSIGGAQSPLGSSTCLNMSCNGS